VREKSFEGESRKRRKKKQPGHLFIAFSFSPFSRHSREDGKNLEEK